MRGGGWGVAEGLALALSAAAFSLSALASGSAADATPMRGEEGGLPA